MVRCMECGVRVTLFPSFNITRKKNIYEGKTLSKIEDELFLHYTRREGAPYLVMDEWGFLIIQGFQYCMFREKGNKV